MMGDIEPLTECCRSILHVLEMNYLDASSASCSIDPSYSLQVAHAHCAQETYITALKGRMTTISHNRAGHFLPAKKTSRHVSHGSRTLQARPSKELCRSILKMFTGSSAIVESVSVSAPQQSTQPLARNARIVEIQQTCFYLKVQSKFHLQCNSEKKCLSLKKSASCVIVVLTADE